MVAAVSPWQPGERKHGARFRQKKAEMLRAAAAMIRERGYEDTSLNDLADLLHVTKPTIYYYIGNKDRLIFEIKRYAQVQVLDFFRLVQRKEISAYEKMRELIAFYLKVMTSDFGVCFVQTINRKMEEESQKEIMRGIKEANRIIFEVLAEGNEDGSLSVNRPDITGYTIFGALNWAAFWFDENRSTSIERLGKLQADLLLNGIVGGRAKRATGKTRQGAELPPRK